MFRILQPLVIFLKKKKISKRYSERQHNSIVAEKKADRIVAAGIRSRGHELRDSARERAKQDEVALFTLYL